MPHDIWRNHTKYRIPLRVTGSVNHYTASLKWDLIHPADISTTICTIHEIRLKLHYGSRYHCQKVHAHTTCGYLNALIHSVEIIEPLPPHSPIWTALHKSGKKISNALCIIMNRGRCVNILIWPNCRFPDHYRARAISRRYIQSLFPLLHDCVCSPGLLVISGICSN